MGSKEDQDSTREKGTVEGGIVGALVGAAIGAAIDGKEGAKKGAIIGAGLGLIGGAMYGNHVANQKAKFAKEEEYLDACIAEATRFNNETRQYNASLRYEIQSLKTEVDQLVAAYNSGKISKSRLLSKKQEVDNQLAQAERRLQRAWDEVAIQKEVYKREQGQSQTRLAKLNAQISELEETASELEQETNALASISRRMTV